MNAVIDALIEKQYENGFKGAYAAVRLLCALLSFGAFMLVIFITNEAVKVSDKGKKVV